MRLFTLCKQRGLAVSTWRTDAPSDESLFLGMVTYYRDCAKQFLMISN